MSLCCTCHKVSEADGAEGDEAEVERLGVYPAFLHLKHQHGYDEEEDRAAQVRHQVDKEAGALL